MKSLSLFAFEGDNGSQRMASLQQRLIVDSGQSGTAWVGGRRRGGPGMPWTPPTIHLLAYDHAAADVGSLAEASSDWLWVGRCIVPESKVVDRSSVGGLMLNMTDIDPAHEAEFNDWYDSEHLPRLNQDPGLLRAERYRVVTGQPRYLAVYELSDVEVVQTEAWRLLSATPWTERIGWFRSNNQRWVLKPLPCADR